jgi:hypothetical protein
MDKRMIFGIAFFIGSITGLVSYGLLARKNKQQEEEPIESPEEDDSPLLNTQVLIDCPACGLPSEHLGTLIEDDVSYYITRCPGYHDPVAMTEALFRELLEQS